jgi:predicted DNA-binding transcriptional regulator AlpA
MKTLEALPRFLRENEGRHLTSLSRTQRSRLERAGRFRAFGWVEAEGQSWIAARISARAEARQQIAESHG